MKPLTKMTLAEWKAKYKPKYLPLFGVNHFKNSELASDAAIKTPNQVWTRVETDRGERITNGWHFVNRVGYYICEVPFDPDADIEIKVGHG